MNITHGQSLTIIMIRILFNSKSILLYDISSSGCPILVTVDTGAFL